MAEMMRIAVPNKGSLSVAAVELLKDAGYKTRSSDRQLVLQDAENNVEFFYLRPRDIATYVGSGTLDFGITGLDLLKDSESEAVEIQSLGFAPSTFRLAAPQGSGIASLDDLNGKRIATSYPNLLRSFLEDQGVKVQKIVKLDGAVESSIQLGVADAIADVVSTGTTLKQAGLEIFGEPILKSTAVLIRSPRLADNPGAKAALSTLLGRLGGILAARENTLLDFDIPSRLIAEATKIAPGFASPTVSPLAARSNGDSASGAPAEEWSAVRVMVPSKNLNTIMDQLYSIGARAILATEIISSRI